MSTSRDSGNERRRRLPRRGSGIRARVLVGLLALLLVAFLTTGASLYALQGVQDREATDASLQRTADRIATLVAQDPQATTERLLYTAMQQTLTAPNEGMMALVGGRPRWTAPEQVPLRLEDDPELVAWAAQDEASASSRLSTVRTATTTYRVLTLPVSGPSGDPGLLLFAHDRGAEQRALLRTLGAYGGVAAAAIALVIGLAWIAMNRILRPIRLLGAATRRMTDADLGERLPVVGDDDLAELTSSFNAMLGRLEDSRRAQRALVDDAAHELRTPLTIVRGHLELMDPRDPEDAGAVRSLALGELSRMGVLVDDLLTLAQADEPDFLTPQPVEARPLLVDVATKAAALGPQTWAVQAPADLVLWADPVRLTQALLQLCDNAAKYTPSDGAVTLLARRPVAARGAMPVVELVVRDDGPGLPAEDRESVLGRFQRGPTAAGQRGRGLGLDIVGTIARAHGGSLRLDAVEPHGTAAVIALPDDDEESEPAGTGGAERQTS